MTTSKNDINILYLVDKSIYLTKMSRVRFHAMKALGEITNLVYWGPGWLRYSIKVFFEIK